MQISHKENAINSDQIKGTNDQNELLSEFYSMRVPHFIKDALKNEITLKNMIKSPDSLLQNLFKGINDG